MAVAIQQHHYRVAAYLKKKPGADVSLADVVALAEITAQSLQSVFETMDAAVHRELREIADYIAAMKAEIAGLHFNELKHTRIPAAGQELDAVVKAKPSTAKGKYVKKVNLASTMSPGVLLDETVYAR